MKIALGVEYDGRNFNGWQTQECLPTVQETLEKALSIIADHPIKLFCAGRTDAGVHAKEQVVHFETSANRVHRAWIMGTNSHLPESIAVLWTKEVDEAFHARFSAIKRRYQYVIYQGVARPALNAYRVLWLYDELNIDAMQKASVYLLGEHDFSSFRSAECESKSPMRNVMKIDIKKEKNLILIDIEANAFLHHMVRNIVGTLIRVGRGFKTPEWIQEVLLAKDRRMAGETAPAHGLYLTKVIYPENLDG